MKAKQQQPTGFVNEAELKKMAQDLGQDGQLMLDLTRHFCQRLNSLISDETQKLNAAGILRSEFFYVLEMGKVNAIESFSAYSAIFVEPEYREKWISDSLQQIETYMRAGIARHDKAVARVDARDARAT